MGTTTPNLATGSAFYTAGVADLRAASLSAEDYRNAYNSLLTIDPTSAPSQQAVFAGTFTTDLAYFTIGASGAPQLVVPANSPSYTGTTSAVTVSAAPTPTPAPATTLVAGPTAAPTPPAGAVTVPAGAPCPQGFVSQPTDVSQQVTTAFAALPPGGMVTTTEAGPCKPQPTIAALGVWITLDDCLAVTVSTAVATTGLTLNLRIADCDGKVQYTTYSLDGVLPAVQTTFHLPLSPGYLLDLCVSNFGSGLTAATCFVQVSLQHTCQAGIAPNMMLVQGYVTSLIALSYPAMAQGYAPTGTPTVPVGIRGANATAISTNSLTMFFPAGSLAGDLAILFVEAGFGINAPAGWTQRDASHATVTWGSTFSKVLTGADVATGSVTVTTGGSFDMCASIIVFIGGTHWNPSTAFVYDIGHDPATSVTVTTSGAGVPQVGDYGVYFSAQRGNSTITCNRGTQRASATTSASACCALFTEGLTAAGQVTAIYSYTSGAGEKYAVILIIQP